MAANITINGGAAGVSALGAPLAVGTSVALADIGSGSPVSRIWTISKWPAPIATPPAISTPTLANAAFTPTIDGIHQVNLSRVEADGVTTTQMTLLVGVPNASGFVLPTPGVDENLFGTVPGTLLQQQAAKAAGWAGHASAGTNFLMDAYMRALISGVVKPLVVPHFGICGLQQTQVGPDIKGSILFDPTKFVAPSGSLVRTIQFIADMNVAQVGETASIELFNLTDGATVVTLSTPVSQLTPLVVKSASLVVGSGAGQLPNAEKLYVLRLSRTGGPVDFASCRLAGLYVYYS